ncbi:glycosyltransferase [Clostridia bacterium OttesenSCG-928-F22]|nr:glycosyltransferase [Clostridia bacterium OttesenSCG-928-F22]
MMDFLYNLVIAVNVLSLVYVIIVDCVYMIQLITSAISLSKYVKTRYYSDHTRYLDSENTIPISLLVPAYNEEASVVDNVKNLISLDFPEYEVVVINDGSKDATMELLISAFEMVKVEQPIKRSIATQKIKAIYRSPKYENLVVLDKENGGKADALNAGINVSRYPVFVSIDADSLLEKDSLIQIIMPFIKDHRVVGVGGIVRIESGSEVVDGEIKKVGLSKNPLVNLQVVEYLRAFLTGRIGFNSMGILLIVSGAFGAFNKRAVIEVGGYTVDTIGEDMELVVKLHQHLREKKSKYIIQFIPDPVCWTQPPEHWGDLRKQRKRWQIGLVSSLMMHKKMLLNPKYGRIGMVALPYYWLFEMIGPFLETIGYITVPLSFIFGIINLNFFIGFYAVSVLYGIVLSIGALLLEENTFKKYPSIGQLLKLTFYSLIDNFGYRQLNTIFRVEAMLTYRKNKHNWGSMKRKGFGQKTSAPSETMEK